MLQSSGKRWGLDLLIGFLGACLLYSMFHIYQDHIQFHVDHDNLQGIIQAIQRAQVK